MTEKDTALFKYSGKRTVINWFFVEAKELTFGFWTWRVKSKKETIEWIKRCLNPHNKTASLRSARYSKPRTSAPNSLAKREQKERLSAQMKEKKNSRPGSRDGFASAK